MTDTAWRLIAPAEDAGSARAISTELVDELEAVAKQLGLRFTKDEKARKLYLGLPKPAAIKPPAPPTVGVVYPSGSVAERSSENSAARYAPARPGQAATLVKADPDIKVGRHFRLGEFRPKSSAYNALRVHPDLVELLDQIRDAAGGTVHITSGYRPPDYNASVGGESNSYHMDGLAADIYCDHLTTQQLHTLCLKLVGSRGGVGYYPTQGFIHVDVRGYQSRW